jgi:hypothetical protein
MEQFTNHDPIGKRVTFIDSRFYTRDDEHYYPGVTTVLNSLAKGKQYEQWLKSNGFNSDVLMRDAMEQGSIVHEAVQDFLLGKELQWCNEDGKVNYSKKSWNMIFRFVDFYTEFKPETIAVEMIIVSDKLQIGSQLDYVCKINGERWLIDHKTGSLYDTANIQLAALKQLWDEYYPKEKIDRCGIMHLDSTHRGRDAKGKKMQGIGWSLVEVEDVSERWQHFQHVHAIWKMQNPNFKPANYSMPDRISIQIIKDNLEK